MFVRYVSVLFLVGAFCKRERERVLDVLKTILGLTI